MHDQILEFYLNGTRTTVSDPRPELTLLQYIRSLGLTGSKLGCAEGGCGACTVLVSSYDVPSRKISHVSVNACLAPLCSVHDKHVITVEGIGNSKNPHPVQERIAKLYGSQCGFCTPGIVMSLYALLRNNPTPTQHEIEETFDGNLCRCTGYRPILDAAKTFSQSSCVGCTKDSGCCKYLTDASTDNAAPLNPTDLVTFKAFDATQELIFPPGLIRKLNETPLAHATFASKLCTWHRPVTITQLLKLKAYDPLVKIVAGNSEVGIEVKFKNLKYPVLVYPMDIPVLRVITVKNEGVEFGACTTLTNFSLELRRLIAEMPELKTRNFVALLENLRWFAGNQIRNVATIAGNIVTASPISDLNPVFMAAGAVLTVQELNMPSRTIPIREFFLGYRKTALQPAEVLISIYVPFTKPNEFVMAFKQSKRRDDDIAIVTSGMRVVLDLETHQIKESCFAFGGMGPTTIEAKQVEQFCAGKVWKNDLISEISNLLVESDLFLNISSPGGMVEYRRSLACSFLFKFFLHVSKLLNVSLADDESSATLVRSRPVSCGTQVYYDSKNTAAAVGKSVSHTSALKQVTGEAMYTDDVPKLAGELYAGLVMSSKAHAKIKSIDFAEALKSDGVKGHVTYLDVPGSNVIGPVFKDEELFASTEVFCCGQVIALIIADSQLHAQAAAKLVKIEYEELPHILTIEEAIATQSYFAPTKTMQRGDLQKGFAEAQHVVEGEIRVGGQNHFYFETQVSLVIPKPEDDEIEILSSTQNPTETQHLVSLVLGVPSHKIVSKVKRLGGGFGGKETRPALLSCALAVAAKKFKAPIRCMLDRDEDMIICGQRHPFLGKYKVGFTKEGKILALDLQLWSNAGYSADLSIAVMERAVSHSDNTYFIPNIKIHGKVCKTNIHSNTAFRGFGGPQGMLITETWITHVAEWLNKPVHLVRELNMYQQGQETHFNQRLDNFCVPRMWQELYARSDFENRKLAVGIFNSKNKWKKRGISLIPTKFGIAFTARFLNQAGALVLIYSDGSVLLTHGGTEMGQGLHTKMIQICAETLGIPMDRVHISETSTDKVPNTSPTAASASADLNGMAVLDACNQLMARLKPYFEKNPDFTFNQVVHAAYFDRVNLSANGFYKTPDLSYDWETNSGRLFSYFTYGVAVSEVELDVLTGDSQILRSDVLMDLGKSLNPAIDIGQIEGAFVQGIGWSTLEETLFFPNGQLLTKGPGNYKIPSFSDIPIDMRISLLSDSENEFAVHSSKAVGEPPLFLGATVYFALRDAVKSQRMQAGKSEYFRLDSPATSERLRMACVDEFSSLACSLPKQPNEQDWVRRV